MVKQALYSYYVAIKEIGRSMYQAKNRELDAARTEALIIKYAHAVEKGLCLEKPRMGYGVQKINEMFELVEHYLSLNLEDNFCLYMVRDAVDAYLKFHQDNGFENAELQLISQRLEQLKTQLKDDAAIYGGFSTVDKKDMDFSLDDVEKLFRSRHSIREFSGENVSEDDIRKAIELAQLCPSACNRQCTRLYTISREKFLRDLNTDLQGIGGFAGTTDKFLLVTAKQSAFSVAERNQYIVSAAIFAGYLSLSLHAYNIAACTVQRSVTPNDQWDSFRKLNRIPADEQIVVMFALGKYKEVSKVPISKRFPLSKMYRNLG